jgi:hypothetical protein
MTCEPLWKTLCQSNKDILFSMIEMGKDEMNEKEQEDFLANLY